jgi:integrase/recombinase XerC/integrase/recombinase XerD
LKLTEAIGLYLEALEARRAPSNTRKAYRLDLAAFERSFPELELDDANSSLLRSYLAGDDWAPATRGRRRASLASFFRWLTQNDLVEKNPMDKVESVVVPETLPRPVDTEVVESILGRIPAKATPDRDR